MKKYLLIWMLVLTATSLGAADWQGLGFKVVNSSQEDERTTIEMRDSADRPLTVLYSGKVTDSQVATIAQLQKNFYSWKSMKVSSVRYTVFDNGTIEAQVFPAAFADGDMDFMKNIPGHLFFVYKDQLQYSFRLEVNKLFVKIKGYYTEEADLIKKLRSAVKDPQGFIIKRDPEYFIGKLEKLEEELEAQKSEVHRQKKEAERLRLVIAALHNTGLFSGPEAVPEQLVQRIVALKTQSPALKREQIEQQLDAEKFEFKSRHVKIILAVYYSELD